MLNAEGARLLRVARDEILAHPETFNMFEWDCGTFACIGGHMTRAAGLSSSEDLLGKELMDRCGFGHVTVLRTPFESLFYAWPGGAEQDANIAAERINAFLWSYGYPPDEIAPQVEALAEQLVTV